MKVLTKNCSWMTSWRWKRDILGQKPPELYNLSDDIGETVNLSNKRPELGKKLLAEYKIWEADVTDNYEK